MSEELDQLENRLMQRLHDVFTEARTGKSTEETRPSIALHDVAPDLAMVHWRATSGTKGPFDIAEPKTNENNASFQRLTEYLIGHAGNATVQGYYLWKFNDSSGCIGRKPVKQQ